MVTITYNKVCFLHGVEGHCSGIDDKCNPYDVPPENIGHKEGLPLLGDRSNKSDYVAGDYNNQGGIYPLALLCHVHKMASPLHIVGVVFCFFCAALQIIIFLGIYTKRFAELVDCTTQVIGFISFFMLTISVVIFALLPLLWDMFGSDYPTNSLNEIPEDGVGRVRVSHEFTYDRGILLYITSAAVFILFISTTVICCCKCCSVKKNYY
eukprot:GHVR01136561.1.p1 GENE.GHVR01136561.1~~GHVR01136561.1.p1  ORF type:complete len:238 (+),score=49.77 GHVR01136561.1:89-715(+)